MGLAHTRILILPLAAACGLTMAAPALRAQQGGTPGPVGGVEQYSLGEELPPGRSFVIPRLSLQEVYNSNAGYGATSATSQGDEITSISGGFTLEAANRNSVFSLVDSTGGLIYAQQTQPNGVVQTLNVTEKLTLRRWNLLLGENFSYLPSSAFGLGGQGFLGGGSTGLPGIGVGTGFNPYVVPTQTIEAPNVSQISSVTVVQAQYAVNPTSSVNLSGTVGFLHFLGNDLLNSRNVTARFGYDKSLTVKDTISFSYLASILDYPSGISGFTSNYVQVGYRRLIQKRLHLSLSAGPVISHFTPQPGETMVTGGANTVSWSMFATLDYAVRNGSMSANYTHGVSGGSGYLPGATSDQLTANFTHAVSRVWTVGLTGGYSRNSSLEQTSTVGMANTTSTFNTWYAGGSISRPLGHYSSVRFYYNASRQTGNTIICVTGAPCAGPIALTQTGGMSLTWSTRPLPLD